MASCFKNLCILLLVTVSIVSREVYADTPANCTFEEVEGRWTFYLMSNGTDSMTKCENVGETFKYNLELMFPDETLDQYGNKGFWTMVYNQGFEVVSAGRKFFAFSKYQGEGENATSFCGETMVGYSHDVLGRNGMCFHGKKTDLLPRPKPGFIKHKPSQMYKANANFISEINSVQSMWKADTYNEYSAMTVGELMQRSGGHTAQLRFPHKTQAVDSRRNNIMNSLPAKFDWRNINGVSFVSPVRNQESCGSCYAFSSMGMLEARIRIALNNTVKPQLSPQDVVDCSKYSQGCDGGFPYLIAGKYAEDFGAVDESCNPYRGKDGSCQTKQGCKRWYATKYHYVGGYYGGCTEHEMMQSLYLNGPMSVSFEVYSDFQHYKGGIYKHTGLQDKFNPFEITNHAVLVVGWGEENKVPYWIVKNSWGESWGEDGYFRILRGADECAIESIAVEAFPIF